MTLYPVFKAGIYIIGFLVFVVILYSACSWLLPKIHLNSDYKESSDSSDYIEIYIRSNGVHTDIVVPANHHYFNWTTMFPYSSFEKVDSTYSQLSIGWGDRGFYLNTPTWSELKFSTAFKAVFGLSTSVMHLTYCQSITEQDGQVIKRRISSQQYRRLIDYILSSFAMANGKPELIVHPGYDEYDNFYVSNGTYSLFKTCNVWTGKALAHAGIKVGCWTPFEWNVMDSLQ
jgi:uncharacterized protein (TIGR02117 family)